MKVHMPHIDWDIFVLFFIVSGPKNVILASFEDSLILSTL